jgi:hypothetical protein
MASITPRRTEQFRPAVLTAADFHVDELAADQAGSLSPFGPDMQFPLPIEHIRYTHPGPADRPYLADGR